MGYQIEGGIKFGNGEYKISLPIVHFVEDGVEILFAPSLEITGYGNSFSEAKQSFDTSLGEFIRYTHNKKTLETILKGYGWSIKKGKVKQFKPPINSDLIVSNELYNSIVNSKSYRSYIEELEFEM